MSITVSKIRISILSLQDVLFINNVEIYKADLANQMCCY